MGLTLFLQKFVRSFFTKNMKSLAQITRVINNIFIHLYTHLLLKKELFPRETCHWEKAQTRSFKYLGEA